ncbi:MAG: glycogen debranching enzyme GlgX [Spirochaetes bacterium]|nr:glycogen debranching enzyme GlgX [Spirochaetota bacterium]
MHFSVFSSVAEKIELCLFDAHFTEINRVALARTENDIWRVFVAGVAAGLYYGYRVHGVSDPEQGLYCDPRVVLLDTHARVIQRLPGSERALGKIVFDNFDWSHDTLPRIHNTNSVIYEAHVRGLTMHFPGIPDAIRGTYLALAHEKVIAYLRDLGVTTLELLPVHAKCNDDFLQQKGLTNYWGYSTLSFFAPEPRYAVADPILEFKTMVKALHKAGIEVILDVVYNHTAEMGKDGPLLSWRGFDNRAYYAFDAEHGFVDYTGCGNTLNLAHAATRQLVLQSLRYWADEMHVDGFRFDLAPALFRAGGAPDMHGEFGRALLADPLLSKRKLIAEPWDLGPGGYARDAFAAPWYVWNDRFRDSARRFWLRSGDAHELAHTMCETDVINFVTCHDGFTLNDLVSYREKHNAANREENRDGADENYSANFGHEGETDDAETIAARARAAMNLIATLIFARGVPMLLAGDEFLHSQQGNNNAYCQDNELTHLAWQNTAATQHTFLRAALGLRARFDWRDAVFEPLQTENTGAFGFQIRFAESALLFLAHAGAGNALFRLPVGYPAYLERLHTARAVFAEAVWGIYALPPQAVVVLEGLGQP